MLNPFSDVFGSPFSHFAAAGSGSGTPPQLGITVTDVPQSEAEILAQFYHLYNGRNWANKTGWLADTTVGNWHGITVSDGHVVEINLYDNGVTWQQKAFFDDKFPWNAATIKAQAGIESGVTPGVANGVTPGLTGATVTQSATLEVTNKAEAVAAASSGSGTLADPFVIKDKKWDSLGGINFFWNDPDADYYIKLSNCHFLLPETANIRVNISSALERKSGIFIDSCLLYNHKAGVDHIILDSGYLKITATHFNRCGSTRALVRKNSGDDCEVFVRDCLYSGRGSAYAFTNAQGATGGVIDIDRFTIGDTPSSLSFIFAKADVKININRLDMEEIALLWQPCNSSTLPELTLGFTITNSNIIAKNQTVFGWVENGKTTVKNGLVSHCYFFSDVSGQGGIRMGPKGTSGNDSHPQNVVVSHCLFERPAGVSGPGEEMCEIFGAEGCCIEHCWTINGEDAYEYHTSRSGNVVRYCGGESVGGQMVDCFVFTGTPGYHIHHIFGECGDAGVLVTNTLNALIHDIYTDNASGTSSEPSAAGAVVLERRGTGPKPNKIKVLGPLPAVSQSKNGMPFATVGEMGSNIYVNYNGTVIGTDFDLTTGV